MSASHHNLNQQVVEINYIEVNTFADLPAPGANTGEIIAVLTTTGSLFLFNLKRAGFYLSNGVVWTRLGQLQPFFTTDKFVLADNADNTKKMLVDLTGLTTGAVRKLIMPDFDVSPGNREFQALINNRKTAPQVVSTLSGENDNIITFPVPNPLPTAPTVINFDGTILSILQRHPTKFSELNAFFVFTNSHNSSVNVTVNFRVSIDGGATFPIIANSETFPMLPRSGAVPSSVFPAMNEWVSPQPSIVPVLFKIQVFADVAGVVTVEPGCVLAVKGIFE